MFRGADVTFRLRPSEPGDIEALARVHHACWVETYGHLLPEGYFAEHTVETFVERRRSQLGTPHRVEWLAESDAGQIIGFCVAGPARAVEDLPSPARERALYGLYVLAAHHGAGVGQALLEVVLPPGQPAELWVARDNPRARAFYRRNGFDADGTAYVDPRFADLPEIRMVRP